MNWEEFKTAAPEMAARGEKRFESTGAVLLGTLRKNGWPRICPVESLITDGYLYLGMIWQSRKALDLLRDPRCVVHNMVTDRFGKEGEFKLYGEARDIRDEARRKRYGKAMYEKIGWDPPPPYHLFAIDILSAAFTEVVDGEIVAKRWTPEGGEEIARRWKPE